MARRDDALLMLLDLNGFLAEVGGGWWVKLVVQRVPPDKGRPHGVSYTLTLHEPRGRRVLGIDNAHAVRAGRGPAGRALDAYDHVHQEDAVRRYVYRGAETLMSDFWRGIE